MKGCIYIFVWFTYGWISVVDDLSHEVSEEDGLSDDGEPRKQMTGTQSQQLRRHLQHGEPQQPHSSLNLKRGDRFRRYPTKKHKLHTAGSEFLPLPLHSLCPHWRSWCFRYGVCFSACSSSCAWPPLRTGRSCCETA